MKKIILSSIVLTGLFVASIVFSASQTIFIPTSPTGQFYRDDMTWATVSGSGTVTSVAMTVPTGLSISGSPITADGTLALSLTGGYVIPLTASTTEWATAYGWGDSIDYTDAAVNSYIHASTTIPKLYTNNTFTGLNVIPYASTTALTVSGTASTTSLTVSSLNAASCDVKSSTSGVFSCGTDATGAGGNDPRLIMDALDTGEQHDVTASVALTEITALSQTLAAGTYTFRYYVIYQSNQLTNGIRLAVNYSGTNGAFVWNWRWADLAATAATAVPDQDDIDAAGNVTGTFQSRAESTTTRGVTLSVDTINADMFIIIEGVFVATGDGDLELWHGSELATAAYTTSVMIGTSVEIHKTK